MANLSDQTRKEQVHAYLLERKGRWVDGTELANERVGGSEGLKRVRELRTELAREGATIVVRKHPDPERDIFQYRLIDQVPPEEVVSPRRQANVDDVGRYIDQPRGLVFGEAQTCDRCKGRTKLIASVKTAGVALFRDPDETKEVCRRCNGWGVIPVVSAHR